MMLYLAVEMTFVCAARKDENNINNMEHAVYGAAQT